MEAKKQIVIYSATSPTAFVYKFALLLKNNNYETVFFTMCNEEQFDQNFYKEAFDKIICSNFQFSKSNLKKPKYLLENFPRLIKFLTALNRLNPYVVIGISGNNWQLKLAHKLFFKKHPFVYFPYDILSHFFNSMESALKSPIAPKIYELNSEKYLFENSDGILHKGSSYELEPIEGRVFKKINLAPLQLNFSPYCSKEFNVPINKNKLSKKDKELHFVYTGFLANNPESAKIFKQYFKDITSQGIHMHIYTIVGHVSKEKEREYIVDFFKDVEQSKYLHLHKALGAKEIVKEISQYDFALWLSYETNEDNIESVHSVGNKISTYLEAGLPIVYNKNSVYLHKILRGYGLDLSFTNKNLKTINKRLKKMKYNHLIKKLEEARKDFDMDVNFPRLDNFLKQVVKNKRNE